MTAWLDALSTGLTYEGTFRLPLRGTGTRDPWVKPPDWSNAQYILRDTTSSSGLTNLTVAYRPQGLQSQGNSCVMYTFRRIPQGTMTFCIAESRRIGDGICTGKVLLGTVSEIRRGPSHQRHQFVRF